jgi:phage terminase large subunit-like protein
LFADRSWGVQAINIKGDKWARASSVVDMFTDGMISAPAQITDAGEVRFLDWADAAIREIAIYPRGSHDDTMDSMTMALKYLRDNGYAVRKDERDAEERDRSTHRGGSRGAIYPV